MRNVLQLALEARICVNSARKAFRDGPASLRGDAGTRAAEVMAQHGWTPMRSIHNSEPPRAA